MPTNANISSHFFFLVLLFIIIFSFIPKTLAQVGVGKVNKISCTPNEKHFYDCRNETFERFHCCFTVSGTTQTPKQDWDLYEGILGPNGISKIEIEYCKPNETLSSECNRTIERFKNQTTDEVVCAALPAIASSLIPNSTEMVQGRCRSTKEKKVVGSVKFFGKKLYEPESWGHDKVLVGQPCDYKAYTERNIPALLERYILCPYDRAYMETEFDKLLEEAYYLDKMLYRLCLGSRQILECKNVNQSDPIGGTDYRCVCMQRSWTIRRSKDVTDMIEMANTSPYLKPGEHSPYHLYVGCKVNGPSLSRLKVLPDLQCEQDAACESTLKPNRKCVAKDDCKCICSRGYKCEGDDGRSRASESMIWKKVGPIMTTFFVMLSLAR
ncbi:hypothetical protein Fcan01_04133 [Folsomia candida]|uniref:Uncharacterized protein n=1 Tax=Folsomia candida TaxID=158441 RepID=A0A226ENU0_FOLCA|nr:hypothetical protein Fcan01_04133 [Folsomia candida]